VVVRVTGRGTCHGDAIYSAIASLDGYIEEACGRFDWAVVAAFEAEQRVEAACGCSSARAPVSLDRMERDPAPRS
jgi:hypothetical protein